MEKKILSLGIIVIILTLGLSGCTEERSFVSDDRLLGTWKNTIIETEIIMFFPDGTWASMGSTGIWTIEDRKLIITTKTSSGNIDYTYDYSFSNDNKLTLTRNNDISKVYTKQ